MERSVGGPCQPPRRGRRRRPQRRAGGRGNHPMLSGRIVFFVLLVAGAALGVRFEAAEHVQVCRAALERLGVWRGAYEVRLVRVDALKQQEFGSDHLRIRVSVDGRSAAHEYEKDGLKKGTPWREFSGSAIRFLDSVAFSVDEIDSLANDHIGVWSPTAEALAAHAGRELAGVVAGDGGRYRLTIRVDKAPKGGPPRPPPTPPPAPGQAETVTLKRVVCVNQEDYTGKDHVQMVVWTDGRRAWSKKHEFEKKHVYHVNRQFTYTRSFKMTLTELDTLDSNDELGEIAWAAGEHTTIGEQDFSSDAITSSYRYTAVFEGPTRGATPPPGTLPAVSSTRPAWMNRALENALREPRTQPVLRAAPVYLEEDAQAEEIPEFMGLKRTKGPNKYWMTFSDVCAMAGDFFSGRTPKTESIFANQVTGVRRTPKAQMDMFRRVFREWFANSSPDFGLMVERVITRFDVEAAAIARHTNAGHAVMFAYAEDEAPSNGGTSALFVTNAHSVNYGRITSRPSQRGVESAYSSDLTMVADLQLLSSNRFLDGASWNSDHFMPSGAAQTVYKIGHELAIEKAVEARKKNYNRELLREALAMEAHAIHFLSDCFSSGHQRTERLKQMQLAAGMGCGTDGSYVGLVAKLMHDEDNDLGIWVKDKLGAEWLSFGDRSLNHPGGNENLAKLIAAIEVSVKDVIAAWRNEGAQCETAEACIAARTSDPQKSVYSRIPDWKLASRKNHAPLFYLPPGASKYLYRTADFRTDIDMARVQSDPAYRARFYSDNWDCDAIYDPTQISISNRRSDYADMARLVRQKQADLARTHSLIMDADEDGKVTLGEFENWLRIQIVDLEENTELDRINLAAFIAAVFFTIRDPATADKDLTYVRVDDLVAAFTYDAVRGTRLTMTLDEYVVFAWEQFKKTENYKKGPNKPSFVELDGIAHHSPSLTFPTPEPLAASSTRVERRVDSILGPDPEPYTPPPSVLQPLLSNPRRSDVPLSGCYAPGLAPSLNWCTLNRQFKSTARTTVEEAAKSMDDRLATLKKLKFIEEDGKMIDVLGSINMRLHKAQGERRRAYVAKRDGVYTGISKLVTGFWRSVTAMTVVQPDVDDAPEVVLAARSKLSNEEVDALLKKFGKIIGLPAGGGDERVDFRRPSAEPVVHGSSSLMRALGKLGVQPSEEVDDVWGKLFNLNRGIERAAPPPPPGNELRLPGDREG